jgi:hypothetical protein
MRISSVFSYYGGKSKIINCYPPPKYELIIEPFAGAAAYGWRWHEHQVWVNELDARVYAIWEFLLRSDALEMVRKYVPVTIKAGTKVDGILPHGIPLGLFELVRSQANMGTQGGRSLISQVTWIGAHGWKHVRPKMEEIIPNIQHWTATNLDYAALPNLEATWFIDPPYSNPHGMRYRQADINYKQLAQWCRSRKGQVIVCENLGAKWLPFKELAHGRIGLRTKYHHVDAQEVLWHQMNPPIL